MRHAFFIVAALFTTVQSASADITCPTIESQKTNADTIVVGTILTTSAFAILEGIGGRIITSGSARHDGIALGILQVTNDEVVKTTDVTLETKGVFRVLITGSCDDCSLPEVEDRLTLNPGAKVGLVTQAVRSLPQIYETLPPGDDRETSFKWLAEVARLSAGLGGIDLILDPRCPFLPVADLQG